MKNTEEATTNHVFITHYRSIFNRKTRRYEPITPVIVLFEYLDGQLITRAVVTDTEVPSSDVFLNEALSRLQQNQIEYLRSNLHVNTADGRSWQMFVQDEEWCRFLNREMPQQVRDSMEELSEQRLNGVEGSHIADLVISHSES